MVIAPPTSDVYTLYIYTLSVYINIYIIYIFIHISFTYMTYLTYITYTYVHCIAFTFNILQFFMFHLPITSCHFPFTIYQLPVI